MIDLSPEIITIIMFGGILLGVFLGYPLAFPIGGIALVIGFLAFGPGVLPILYSRLFSMIHNYIMVAVPLFVFMGIMLELDLMIVGSSASSGRPSSGSGRISRPQSPGPFAGGLRRRSPWR